MRTQVILAFGLVCLFIMSFGMSAHADVVGYWSFDEGDGDVVGDISGNGNDGELVGDTEWVEGKDGTAMLFANQGYVEVPNEGTIVTFGATDFTAMVWMKIENEEMDTSKLIIGTGSCCWTEAGFYICICPGGTLT